MFLAALLPCEHALEAPKSINPEKSKDVKRAPTEHKQKTHSMTKFGSLNRGGGKTCITIHVVEKHMDIMHSKRVRGKNCIPLSPSDNEQWLQRALSTPPVA